MSKNPSAFCTRFKVFSAIAFGMANAKKLIERQHKKVSIAFEPIWNVYNGRKSIQLLIKDIGE